MQALFVPVKLIAQAPAITILAVVPPGGRAIVVETRAPHPPAGSRGHSFPKRDAHRPLEIGIASGPAH